MRIRQMLDDGIRLYNRGMLLHSTAEKEGTSEAREKAREEARAKFREAYTKFEQALQKSDQDPDQRGQANLVYAFLERAGKERVASMINSPDPQMRDIGNRLFRIAQPGEPLREPLRDPGTSRNLSAKKKCFVTYETRRILEVIVNNYTYIY